MPSSALGVGAMAVTKIAEVCVLMELDIFQWGVGRDVCTKQKQTICIKCLVRFVTVIKMKHHGETEYLVAPVC